MKQIALITFGLISAAVCKSMEKPTPQTSPQQVILAAPLELLDNAYVIKAFLNNQKIGSVHYRYSDKAKVWYIKNLTVANKYRHSNNKVGSQLFNACIQDMRNKYANIIEWTIVPTQGSNLTVPQLEKIYEKMVQKLELPAHRLDKKPFGYATEMTLQFQ